MNVFVSHASTDADMAANLADYLRANGFDVWDEREVFPGDS